MKKTIGALLTLSIAVSLVILTWHTATVTGNIQFVPSVNKCEAKRCSVGGDDLAQTIPPIGVSSIYSQAECTVLNLSPGTVVSGTSGVITADCFNRPAILFGATSSPGSEMPTFLLATGWIAVGIVNLWGGASCGFNGIYPGLSSVNLTSAQPIPFLPQGTPNNTELTKGSYDYCLYYSNPPAGGILTFTVSWSP